jgi:osmoprotectant transport system permease protein
VVSVQNRVLLSLSLIGLFAFICAGYIDTAPNRLANSTALTFWRIQPLLMLTLLWSLTGLLTLSFQRQQKPVFILIAALAATLLFANFLAAGLLASQLAAHGPKAMRISLDRGFWALLLISSLTLLNIAQQAQISLVRRGLFAALLAVALGLMARLGLFNELSLAKEFGTHSSEFSTELFRHMALCAAAMILSLGGSIPLTYLVLHRASLRGKIFATLGILQTIPSIALFGLLIAPLTALGDALPFLKAIGVRGTGPAPAIIALTLYSLLPLVRNISTGFSEVAFEVKEAALGIGYGGRRLFFNVELPLALPAVLSGLRVVLIQAIGLAAVAALIGAGGLGVFIFQGIGQYALDLVLIGAIPIIFLALAADFGFAILTGLAQKSL